MLSSAIGQEYAARFTVDLDFKRLSFHGGIVFFVESRVAKCKVIVWDDNLITTDFRNGVVEKFAYVCMTHLGWVDVVEPPKAVDVVD